MTRVNCIPPSELTRQHLVAEYREIIRVFALARAAHARGWTQTVHTYRLGAGHVTFFYDKLEYIRKRHAELVDEMIQRGYTPTISCDGLGLDLPEEYQQDWEPTTEAVEINRQRIQERLATTQGKEPTQ